MGFLGIKEENSCSHRWST